jgi:DNA-binding beta-propeller fold protein YncE
VPSILIDISDATVKEQGNLGTLVPGNASILEHPSGLAFGHDRTGDGAADLYAVGRVSNNIAVYDGRTGAFAQQLVPAGSGLNGSAWVAVGPDGDLYTSTRTGTTGARDTVLRVDHATGAVSTFVPGGYGGLAGATGMTFGPDGNFYVSNGGPMEVLRYDGTTGVFMGAFVTAGSGGLANPGGVLFGPDRNGDSTPELYVASSGTDQVLVFDGLSGTPLGVFVAAGSGDLDGPWDMQFGPDGNLYVVASATSYEQVFRFDGASGAFIDTPVAAGSGLDPETAFIAFDPQGALCVSGENANNVLRLSAGPLVTLSGPSTDPVTVDFSTAAGTATPGSDYGAVRGRLTFAPGETEKRVLISAVDDGVAEPSETLTVNPANAIGAAIVGGQSTVTIVNSQTKFFVVNDDPSNPGFA